MTDQQDRPMTRVEITLEAAKVAMRWHLLAVIEAELRRWGKAQDGTESLEAETLRDLVEAVLTDPKTIKGTYAQLSEWVTT
jgi:hypothetical protein